MARLNLKPDLPAHFPHRRLIMQAFDAVSRSTLGTAFYQHLVGDEMVEMALKSATFDLVVAQDQTALEIARSAGMTEEQITGAGLRRDRGDIADSMLRAITIARGSNT